MFFTQNISKEKMESTNTTDNNYGRQELPPVLKSGERLISIGDTLQVYLQQMTLH